MPAHTRGTARASSVRWMACGLFGGYRSTGMMCCKLSEVPTTPQYAVLRAEGACACRRVVCGRTAPHCSFAGVLCGQAAHAVHCLRGMGAACRGRSLVSTYAHGMNPEPSRCTRARPSALQPRGSGGSNPRTLHACPLLHHRTQWNMPLLLRRGAGKPIRYPSTHRVVFATDDMRKSGLKVRRPWAPPLRPSPPQLPTRSVS